MADQVKGPRRAYNSPLRADQAQQTRRRILEAARELFVDRGYAGTTVAAVAADKEAFAAALGRRLLAERLTNQTRRIDRYLGEALRPGLSVAEAGERYCALASPELYHVLTVELGWAADRHMSWLSQLLRTELLGSQPEHARRRTSTR